MKKCTKILLGSAVGTAAAVYGACTLIDNLLLNRHMVPSPEFSAKVTGCDLSDREEEHNKHKLWLENYGYEKYYMLSDRGEQLTAYLVKPEKESNVYAF